MWPVKTNAGFLARTLADPDFVQGAVDTGFIEARQKALVAAPGLSEPALGALAHAALEAELAHTPDRASPWVALAGFRVNAPPRSDVRLQSGDAVHSVAAAPGPVSHLVHGDEIVAFEAGEAYVFTTPRFKPVTGAVAGDGAIRSIMPGKIVATPVSVGAEVRKGDALVVVEAMKMEQTLTAPFDGTLVALSVKPGDQVEEGVVIARLETRPA